MSDLLTRQADLQAEAGSVLAALTPLGPLSPTGSFVSGLMVWKELDVMRRTHPGFSPPDVLELLHGAVDLPGLTGFHYADERGPRSPTGERRDERYHVGLTLRDWRIDLSLWLYDDHAHVTAFHESLRERLTADQRLTILEIKDVWHRRPESPDEVSGFEIYTAVLEHGVRTPSEFGAWWARA
ncbi:MAG TPA: hypothetical protein VH502_16170 [Actinoplanes sp.]